MKRFPSLKSSNDFKNVYNNGISYGNKFLVMYVIKNNCFRDRLGISVSKKVGNSVVRHRLTRQLREIFRLENSQYKNNKLIMSYDIIIIVRVNAAALTYHKLESAYMRLCGKLGLKDRNNENG
jgi:ribonuclease P protein component